jgi:diguanylate cyclase (GGDEF)-like protein/PAS domain S-box-containing protein
LSQDYKVRLAPSGDIGLKAARSMLPDLILLDVMMSGMNGYEVATQLKADERTAEIPIIFISALDNTESKILGFTAGGVDYITKPFQEKEVLARVHTHLSLRALYLQAQKEIAERKRIEENLRKREQEFKTLVENTPDVIARFDRQFRHIYVNPIVEKEFGTPPAKLLGKTHRELGQPPEAADWSENIIRQVFETGQEVVFELATPTPAGNKYYLSRGVPEFAEDGSVISALIIHRNITERKQAEEHIRQLSRAVESSPTSIVITDTKGDIQYVNPKFTEVTGYSFSEAIGKNPRILKSDQTPPDVHIGLWETIPKGKEWHGEFCNRKKNGDLYWESASISPITDSNGVITHYVAVKEDITERKKAEDALAIANKELHQQMAEIEKLQFTLREQAIRDSLTGLHNRRYMEESLTREYARAVRKNEPLSIVMIDIDGLKKFNDTYGHDVGDQAIKTFADQLKLMTRKEDIACRYGGDEFLVIFYNTDIENASKRVKEWHTKVNNANIPYQGGSLHIAFSAGVATYPTHGESIDEIVKAADEALYRQKGAG